MPDLIPVLAVRNTVLFPVLTVPLNVGRNRSLAALRRAEELGGYLAVFAQVEPATEDPGEQDLFQVGSVCKILRTMVIGDGKVSVVVQGLARCKAARWVTSADGFLNVRPDVFHNNNEDISADAHAKGVMLRKLVKTYLDASLITSPASVVVAELDDPALLADLVAANIGGSVEDKQLVLEAFAPDERIDRAIELVQKAILSNEVISHIEGEAKGEIEKGQRDYVLREQLKAIQKELGDGDEGDDHDELRKQVAVADMPPHARKAALKEIKRLKRMNPASSEYSVGRAYVEWLIEIPWSKSSEDHIDLDEAQRILDEDHHGLDKVKDRIVEHLAVRKLKADMKGPILCLVGPPGVGKTSLAKSIARATGREYCRISLGGVRDEAEIRGHRRTYIGSLPGQIIKGLKKAGTNNPVFVFDEVDKLGKDWRGDPASALLEVLDPEQNDTFTDHYIDLAFDLSKVMFLCTANQAGPIPGPLRDRMEIIELSGYTIDEKIQIARKHVIPEQLEEHGLTADHIVFESSGLELLVQSYTREAGVRGLKREIAAMCRNVAKGVAKGETGSTTIDAAEVAEIRGPIKYFNEVAERTSVPGVATGLAWTAAGGDILFIEATSMEGDGKMKLSGSLGDVMKESIGVASSYIRSMAKDLGIDPKVFKATDIHVHVPSGATPKDGPSAGVTMLTAIVSLLTGICVDHELAMTGEATLRGAVLPVGGIKEKVLAAHRAGIKRLILPEKNRKDLPEIPEEVQADLDIVFCSRMEDVLEAALGAKQLAKHKKLRNAPRKTKSVKE
jgi:ATP-dependent Lon protease